MIKVLKLTFVFLFLSCQTLDPPVHEPFQFIGAENGTPVIYFYRVPSIIGFAVSFEVLMDRNEIGLLKMGSYFRSEISSDKHSFIIKVAGNLNSWMGRLSLEAEKERVYFVKVSGLKAKLVKQDVALKEMASMYNMGSKN